MKVLGISGSPRKNGNTDIMIQTVLQGAQANGLDTEFVSLNDLDIKDCTGCEGCAKSNTCIINDDMSSIYTLLEETDALILGSPTYFYNVTGIMKIFLDRLYCWCIFDKNDRSIWTHVNAAKKDKKAIIIAICEQKTVENMGFTDLAMSQSIECIGYQVTETIKILNVFAKGAISKEEDALDEAYQAGEKLAKMLLNE